MRRFVRFAPRALFVVEAVLAFSILHDVANVTTYRLYLSNRADTAARSTATERFVVEDTRVMPQIAMRDDDRVAFAQTRPWPTTLRVAVRADASAQYEIRWRQSSADRVLASTGSAGADRDLSIPVPVQPGVLEFVSRGDVTWVDPRLVTRLRVSGRAVLLVAIGAVCVVIRRRGVGPRSGDACRVAGFKSAALAGGIAAAVLSLEAGLRALGDRVPPPIVAQRRDLGEVRRDPRWEYTARYGRRLRPRISDVSEWRYGDIVRLGFVPADVSDGVVHRFAFQTDDEGFRNARTRARIDVAALGDSFTDAMTLDAGNAWPTILERETGLAVQNYGTAGFGPQQELRVLTDYALRHHPRIVVLAWFAGNDIFDAEAFDEYERSGGTVHRPDPGWPIRSVVNLADHSYVISAVHAFSGWASNQERAEAQAAPPPAEPLSSAPRFDRGMFTIPINGSPVHFALMPPYLDKLKLSFSELETRDGWRLASKAIAQMRDASGSIGARLVVLFLPSKSQIYLPLIADTLPAGDVERAFRFYLPDAPFDVSAMAHNRLAQNTLLREFCARAHIPFVDATDALAAGVRQGKNVYYPDESHLNETGHAIVAETLRPLLR